MLTWRHLKMTATIASGIHSSKMFSFVLQITIFVLSLIFSLRVKLFLLQQGDIGDGCENTSFEKLS